MSEGVKIFPTTHFGYRKITVERPLRLNFQASAERIARLEEERAFINLAVSRKKAPEARRLEEEAGRAQQESVRKLLAELPDTLYIDRAEFVLCSKKKRERQASSSARP